jgi:uroporphyrinogen-III synthase
MSTTLVPPSYYVVKPRGRPPRLYSTLREVAGAIYTLARTPATVSAITGSRRRSLTDVELRDLGREVRAVRLYTRTARSAIAVAPLHEAGVLSR